jgi:hypothetical protein
MYIERPRYSWRYSTDTTRKSLPTAPLKYCPPNHALFFSSYTTPTYRVPIEYRLKRKEKGEFLPTDRLAIFHLDKASILQSKITNKFSYTRKTIYTTLKRY